LGTHGAEDAQAKGGAKQPDQSRRRFLRLIALAGVGGAAVVLVPRLLVRTAADGPSQSKQTQMLATGQPVATVGGASMPSTKVNVRFFQMSQAVSVTQENFFVQSPAKYSDLLAAVESKYPKISTMVPTMLVLVDGIPARAATPLKDGDEVDFIPAIAGG
jgi:molybdopterin converting factor small subunit